MARLGTVLSTSGSTAQVSTSRKGLCEHCTEQGACSAQIGQSGGRADIVTVKNAVGAQVGDTVEIELPGHTEMKLSFWVWLVPLAGLLLGAIAGAAALAPLGLAEDPAAFLGAIAGFLASYLLLRRLELQAQRGERFQAAAVKVVRSGACAVDGAPSGRLSRQA